MKKIHYRNIGFPKTGTTWLWHQLMANPSVDAKFDGSMKEFNPSSIEEYQIQYNSYDVSVNLYTWTFITKNPKLFISPKRISEHTTHLSLTFRNPYELLDSWYNFMNRKTFKISKEDYLNVNNDDFVSFTDMSKLFSNWNQSKLPIKYMFYDDLVDDDKKYIYELCDFLGIEKYYKISQTKSNLTDYKDPLLFTDTVIIDIINDTISAIEEKTKRDLSHWKRSI